MEVVRDAKGTVLAYLVRKDETFAETTFVSPPEVPLQFGFVVYGAGKSITAHSHVPIERTLQVTGEFLWVRQGRCTIDIFDDLRNLVVTRELVCGDAVLLLSGGHGFHMIEDTVLGEVKQGPYFGLWEKERF